MCNTMVTAVPLRRSNAVIKTMEEERANLAFCREGCDGISTAESSVSSGDIFAGTQFKAASGKRGILRAESKITSQYQEQPAPPKQRNRIVRFSSVLIRDYDIILGDHPCCAHGPPLSIGWNYTENEVVSLNQYEWENAFNRRSSHQLTLNHHQRKHLLREYSDADISAVTREIKRINRNRGVTKQLVPCQPIETVVESACRKLKRLVIKQNSSRMATKVHALSES